MFLNGRGRYNRDGEQTCAGDFLLVFNQKPGGPLRCVVRHVRMRQCGHFMMGSATVGPFRLTLSGTYGHDGLPLSPEDGKVPKGTPFAEDPETGAKNLWARLHPMPDELVEAFWKGGGHNTGGSEMPLLKEWALEHLAELRGVPGAKKPQPRRKIYRREDAQRKLADVYYWTRHSHWTFQRYLEAKQAYYAWRNGPDVELTRYDHGYLDGLSHAWYKDIEHSTEHRHEWDGKLLTRQEFKALCDAGKASYEELNRRTTGGVIVWKDAPDKIWSDHRNDGPPHDIVKENTQ